MNWGTRIIIGMGSFMVFILGLGWFMVTSDQDGLVENDYYEKGLRYDENYRLKQQVIKDNAAPEVNVVQGILSIQFRSASRGDIQLICLADKSMDRKLSFNTSSDNSVKMNGVSLQKGAWRLKINWESNGKYYLSEKEIILP